MAKFSQFFNPRCPGCGRKSLASRRCKPEPEDSVSVMSATTWLWTSCTCCGKRFKEQHFGNGRLHEVADDEWQANVAAS